VITGLDRVVVGVSARDGYGPAEWAAGEAHARHAALRIVTARPASAALDLYVPNDVAVEHHTAARRLLDELADFVTAEWPDLVVTTELATGPPGEVLRAAAENAVLLVVGSDDASPFMEAISGSVPGDLLTTAPCPLAVVPRREWTETTRPASAPVVVAIDETDSAHAALAYAYATASRAGRPLTILRCVTPGHVTPNTGLSALTAFGGLFPDVAAAIEVAEGDPRVVLTTASRNATALVLGSRGRGRLTSGLFGSVSRTLIRQSQCPVVIARGPHTVRQHTPAAG
jgi:nucleotide-binding universal stress UspA family protein